ncbi:MAG: hypothetical protein ABIZ69_06385 [Ilumatobacteraceae bacterium]
MGLFSKKPKSIIVQKPVGGAPEVDPMDRLEELLPKVADLPQLPPNLPKLEEPTLPKPVATPSPSSPASPRSLPSPSKPIKPQKPPKPVKAGRKVGVDPADFLALRAELVDMRARLDESENARAQVEARLSSLDATASAFSNERNDISEVAEMVLQLQKQVADGATANGTIIDSHEGVTGELSAKVEAIQNRLFGLPDHSPKIAEFEGQIAQLRAELETTSATAAEAVAMVPQASGPDPETLERLAAVQQRVNDLDGVEQRLAGVDGLAAQLQQLNARVAAQAEFGGQLSALRDRVGQLGDTPKGTGDDDIRLQLQEIGERLRSNEEVRDQVAELMQRASSNDNEARAVRDHMAVLDQRLTNVSTELVNQLSELGRDIDGLGQRIPEVAEGNVGDDVVDALRGGQVKLANEQARYEIAFRQDLATLAEQLRHDRDAE